METILLVIHLIIALALIGLILIQRSEGGALGIGGGGGGGMSGFMTGRATANLLTRATAILAAGFFMTSMALTWVAGSSSRPLVQGKPAATGQPVSGKPATGKQAPKKPSGPKAPVK